MDNCNEKSKGKPFPKSGDLVILNDGIYRYNEDLSKSKVSDYINLKQIIYDIDTNKYSAIMEFSTVQGCITKTVHRSDYQIARSLCDFIDDGLDVSEGNYKAVSAALIEKANKMCANLIHTKLGFGIYKDMTVFKLWHGIGVESEYSGNLKIEPQGLWEDYNEFLLKEVFPYTQLQFIIAASLSSVLLGKLHRYLDMDTVLVHLVGDSSSGKSTATKLAISVFASPDLQDETLMSTYHSTQNALIGMIKTLNGLPFALDELSTTGEQSLGNLVYKLCSGKEKARMDADSKMKERESWNAVIFSNGEKSVIDSSSNNTGIQIRTYEISIPQWTNSAQHSETISSKIKNCYAHLGHMFAESVMKRSDTRMIKAVNVQREKLIKKIVKSNAWDDFSERRAKFYSLIMYAAFICKKDLGLPFDLNSLRDFIVEQEQVAKGRRSIEGDFFKVLKNFISSHADMFISKPNPQKYKNAYHTRPEMLTKYWGVYSKSTKHKCKTIGLLDSTMNEIVKLYGHESKKIVIDKLKAANRLDHEKDRNTRSWLINGIKQEFYVILLIEEEEES